MTTIIAVVVVGWRLEGDKGRPNRVLRQDTTLNGGGTSL